MPMAIDEGCIIRASEQFWEQMLAMQLTPVAGPEELNLAAGHVQGRVWLSGAWEGEIEVRMAETLAMMATSVMLMQPLETVAEADTLDATREIANMIAGNIKSALPQPSRMTLPEAAVECAAFQGSTRTADSLGVAFQHAAGDLVVRVQEHGERG
ncbi:MAG TPA: chemotaxis protein CheX [Terracidiphilus sp.]|nr:chemotaxis protein CheX [Terracidiphilus sp.]